MASIRQAPRDGQDVSFLWKASKKSGPWEYNGMVYLCTWLMRGRLAAECRTHWAAVEIMRCNSWSLYMPLNCGSTSWSTSTLESNGRACGHRPAKYTLRVMYQDDLTQMMYQTYLTQRQSKSERYRQYLKVNDSCLSYLSAPFVQAKCIWSPPYATNNWPQQGKHTPAHVGRAIPFRSRTRQARRLTHSTRLSWPGAPFGSTGRLPVMSSRSTTPNEYTSDFSVSLPLIAYSGARYLHKRNAQVLMSGFSRFHCAAVHRLVLVHAVFLRSWSNNVLNFPPTKIL